MPARTPILGWVNEVPATVAEGMLTIPVRHPLSATVQEMREFFRNEHVHAALIVAPAGRLAAVIERADLAQGCAPDAAAAPLGRLAGRTMPAWAGLAEAQQLMTATGRRRAAVVDSEGRLVGLLCLKASQRGFCSDQDVLARAAGSAQSGPQVADSDRDNQNAHDAADQQVRQPGLDPGTGVSAR